MIVSDLDPTKPGLNLSDLNLLDANTVFPAIVGETRDRRMAYLRSPFLPYHRRIVKGIEEGKVKNCAIASSTVSELFRKAEQMPNSSEPFSSWLKKIREGEHVMLYEFNSRNGEVQEMVDKLAGYNCSRSDKTFVATLIVSGISKGVSDDNDIFDMRSQAAKLHVEAYRKRRSGRGYTPLSIIDSKYFCQTNKLL